MDRSALVPRKNAAKCENWIVPKYAMAFIGWDAVFERSQPTLFLRSWFFPECRRQVVHSLPNRGLWLLLKTVYPETTSEKKDHALNLSISVSAGKKTNKDTSSSGERRWSKCFDPNSLGKQWSCRSQLLAVGCFDVVEKSCLERHTSKGDSPVFFHFAKSPCFTQQFRVGLLGSVV